MEELTRLEERIMQCIWNYQGEVPFLDLIEMVKEKLNKDYKRTSIRGYLFRLEEKGYIKVTKKGRKAYVQPLINEESYGKYQAEKVLDRWFDGSAKRLVSALGEKLTKEDGEELRGILDDFDLMIIIIKIFSGIFLCTLLGTILYLFWKAVGRLIEHKDILISII